MADDGSAGTVGRTRYLAAILFGFNFVKISARACLSDPHTEVCQKQTCVLEHLLVKAVVSRLSNFLKK